MKPFIHDHIARLVDIGTDLMKDATSVSFNPDAEARYNALMTAITAIRSAVAALRPLDNSRAVTVDEALARTVTVLEPESDSTASDLSLAEKSLAQRGVELQEERERRHLTRQQLADNAHCSLASVSMAEQGKASEYMLTRLTLALDGPIDPDYPPGPRGRKRPGNPCPFCAREQGVPYAGTTPCERHAREVSSQGMMGEILIKSLNDISMERQVA